MIDKRKNRSMMRGIHMIKKIRNLKVTRKLSLLLFISITSLFLSATIGNINSMTMKNRAETMYEQQMLPTYLFNDLTNMDVQLNQLTLEGLATNNHSKTEESIQKINDDKLEVINKYKKSTSITTNERTLIQTYLENTTQSNELRMQLFKLNLEGEPQEAYSLYLGDYQKLQNDNHEIINKLSEIKRVEASILNVQNKDESFHLLIALSLTTGIAILLQIIISRRLSKMITKPITQLKLLLGKAKEGDFTGEITYSSKDELGELMMSYNEMRKGIKSIIHNVDNASLKVSASSEELFAASHQSKEASIQSEGITLGLVNGS